MLSLNEWSNILQNPRKRGKSRARAGCNVVFIAFSLDCLNGSITHTTGRLAYTIVQGNCLFKVMEQEACQYYTVQYYVTLRDTT